MKAYIDESGDPGTDGKGSRWLTIGAVVVPAGAETQVLAAVSIAEARLGKRLHCVDLRHLEKRATLAALSPAPWTAIAVASDTRMLTPGTKLVEAQAQYNYALRYVLERVSRFGKAMNEHVDEIVFDWRTHPTELEVREYMRRIIKTGQYEGFQFPFVANAVLSRKTDEEETLLRVADCVAHSLYRALEPDRRLGLTEPAYFLSIKEKLWGGPGPYTSVRSHGLVLMPTANWEGFVVEYPWLREVCPVP